MSHLCVSAEYGMNLTIRNSLARFIRKGMNFSKSQEMHTSTFNIFQAWYNFIKIHISLKLRVNCGNKKWEQRTPAMAEGIANHIWPLREMLNFRLPVQCTVTVKNKLPLIYIKC